MQAPILNRKEKALERISNLFEVLILDNGIKDMCVVESFAALMSVVASRRFLVSGRRLFLL